MSRDEIFALATSSGISRPRQTSGENFGHPFFRETGRSNRAEVFHVKSSTLIYSSGEELAAHLPVGGQRLEINNSRFGIKSQSDDSVREIKAIVSGAERSVIELEFRRPVRKPG